MNADDAVKHLATFARPLILSKFRRDSCIVSTAIACDFLTWAGVRAKPIEVELMAYTAAALPLVERGVPFDEWPDEAWSVGIVQEHGDRARHDWQGAHLCTLVEQRILLDLSADQVSRPLRRLNVPGPVVLPWESTSAVAANDAGTTLVYRVPERPDPSFRSSPDWKLRGRRSAIVAELVRLARLVGAER